MSNNVMNQLKKIPLFAELSRRDLKAIAKLVERTQHQAGSEICRQGQRGDTAYFVESGELRVFHVDPQGAQREVSQLGPESFFGETSLFLGEPRDATVEVVQDATLLSLAKDDLDQLLEEQPSILQSLALRTEVKQKRHAPHFKWQDTDEIILVHLHKHKMVLMRHIIFPLFVLLVDIIGCGYWYMQSSRTAAPIVGLILGLVPIIFILYLYVDHKNDNYIVTNKRIVHEERTFIFQESRAEAPLRTVQDIQESQEGLMAQIYGFGNLIIETAGEHGHIVFREIPNPEETRDAIFKQIQRVKATAQAKDLATLRDTIQRHFSSQSHAEETPEPATDSPKQRSRVKPPPWLLAFFHFFTYFLPPLRHEQGNTITWRKHWIALVKPLWLPTLIIVGATLVSIFTIQKNPGNFMIILVGYSTILVFLFPWWLWKFDDWQNDIYQVTAMRIIDVERLPFYLRESRREANLGMIQNIKLEIPGFLGKMLNYGSVTIETAGAGAFTFDLVKDPRGVQAEIFRRVEAFHRQQRQDESQRHQVEMLNWLSAYDQLRSQSPPAASS